MVQSTLTPRWFSLSEDSVNDFFKVIEVKWFWVRYSEFLSVQARLQTINPGPDSAQLRTDWNLEMRSALELVVELK